MNEVTQKEFAPVVARLSVLRSTMMQKRLEAYEALQNPQNLSREVAMRKALDLDIIAYQVNRGYDLALSAYNKLYAEACAKSRRSFS